jgi:hypothetical protein
LVQNSGFKGYGFPLLIFLEIVPARRPTGGNETTNSGTSPSGLFVTIFESVTQYVFSSGYSIRKPKSGHTDYIMTGWVLSWVPYLHPV